MIKRAKITIIGAGGNVGATVALDMYLWSPTLLVRLPPAELAAVAAESQYAVRGQCPELGYQRDIGGMVDIGILERRGLDAEAVVGVRQVIEHEIRSQGETCGARRGSRTRAEGCESGQSAGDESAAINVFH